MGLLDDIADAVVAYPHDYLEIEIVEVDWPGNVINAGEDVTFRFQVSNSGPLDVNELTLLVEGLNGTEVKANGAAAQWVDSVTTSPSYFGNVPAHSANGAGPVVSPGNKWHFKPTRSSSQVKDLVRVSVAGWETSLNHITSGHSREDALAQDTYSSTVSAA
jgi:hypothetical protein